MTFRTLSTFLGWAAVLLGTLAAYAQFSRLRRRGPEGVSLATWTLFVLLAIFWTSYGFAVQSWPLVAGSVAALPLQTAILGQLRPWNRWRVVARSVVFVLVCCVAPALTWGWSGAVVGAGAAGTMTRAPQLLGLLRPTRAAGVSPGSWVLGVLVSSMWVVYYWGAHLWAVLGVTALAGGVSLVIAVLSRRRHLEHELRLSVTEK
jgi:uncharacterized protein with PQ loop repeat